MATTKLLSTPVLDPASTTILVTGASGYIGANVIQEALDLGYHVRGTARTQEKADNTKKVFNNHPNYTTAIVPTFVEDCAAVHDSVKGVDAVILVASDTTFNDDPKVVVDGVVAGTLNFLRAAAREPSVKRFVLTSSSSAALTPIPGKKVTATTESWNDEAVDVAWNKKGESIGPNPYEFIVYAASKTAGEKEFWKFIKEEKPSFVANTVLPNFNVGRIITNGGVTGVMIPKVFQEGVRDMLPPQYYIDVVDNARLHIIAAVLDAEVKDERIYAFAETFNWNKVFAAVKKARPDGKHELKPVEGELEDLSIVPNELGAKLLKKWYGQDGYKSFEDSVAENLKGVEVEAK